MMIQLISSGGLVLAVEALVERVLNARPETIPDTGHGAHPDTPVEFNRAVRQFLEKLQ
jgi:pimeloyl-ACP methyl ester carboxylesterase